MRVLITGGKGYMGRNLARLFRGRKKFEVLAHSKESLNLLNPKEVKHVIETFRPHIIIHAAIKGGTVLDKDTFKDVADNVAMYDNLMAFAPEDAIIFIIASGAEFNRDGDIDCAYEGDLDRSFPTDPYGIAKNIISRRALGEKKNIYVIRLFGCFNYDEDPFRFIKKCILNIKTKKPIEIEQDKLMDFFYMDDVFTVINGLIEQDGFRHMNLVYPDKYSLLNVATLILHATKKLTHPINLGNTSMGPSYTGDGTRLACMEFKLIGLEEGIVKTCRKLL